MPAEATVCPCVLAARSSSPLSSSLTL